MAYGSHPWLSFLGDVTYFSMVGFDMVPALVNVSSIQPKLGIPSFWCRHPPQGGFQHVCHHVLAVDWVGSWLVSMVLILGCENQA